MQGLIADGFYCVSEKPFETLSLAPYLFSQKFSSEDLAWRFLDDLVDAENWPKGPKTVWQIGVIEVSKGQIISYRLFDKSMPSNSITVDLPKFAPFSGYDHVFDMACSIGGDLSRYQVRLDPISELVYGEELSDFSAGMVGPDVSMGFLVSFHSKEGLEIGNLYLSVRYGLGFNLLKPNSNFTSRYNLTFHCSNFTGENKDVCAVLLGGAIDFLLYNSVVNEFNRSVLAGYSPAHVMFTSSGLPKEMLSVVEFGRRRLDKIAGKYFEDF